MTTYTKEQILETLEMLVDRMTKFKETVCDECVPSIEIISLHVAIKTIRDNISEGSSVTVMSSEEDIDDDTVSA